MGNFTGWCTPLGLRVDWLFKMWLAVVGFSGLVLSLVYRIPQIYRLWQRQSADDLSIWMYLAQSVSYILYTIYGVGINDAVYIWSSILAFVQNIIIGVMAYYFYRRKLAKATSSTAELSPC